MGNNGRLNLSKERGNRCRSNGSGVEQLQRTLGGRTLLYHETDCRDPLGVSRKSSRIRFLTFPYRCKCSGINRAVTFPYIEFGEIVAGIKQIGKNL